MSPIPWPKIQFPNLQISAFGKTNGYRFQISREADYPSDSLRFNTAKLCFPFGHDNTDSNQSNPSNVREKN